MNSNDKVAPATKDSHPKNCGNLAAAQDEEPAGGPLNAIAQACLLQETLRTAVQQANGLVCELKRDRKRTKTLRATLLSLKQLQSIDA